MHSGADKQFTQRTSGDPTKRTRPRNDSSDHGIDEEREDEHSVFHVPDESVPEHGRKRRRPSYYVPKGLIEDYHEKPTLGLACTEYIGPKDHNLAYSYCDCTVSTVGFYPLI